MENDSKMIARVPKEWHRQVKIEAAVRGTTLSDIVRSAVDDWLKRNPREEEEFERNEREQKKAKASKR